MYIAWRMRAELWLINYAWENDNKLNPHRIRLLSTQHSYHLDIKIWDSDSKMRRVVSMKSLDMQQISLFPPMPVCLIYLSENQNIYKPCNIVNSDNETCTFKRTWFFVLLFIAYYIYILAVGRPWGNVHVKKSKINNWVGVNYLLLLSSQPSPSCSAKVSFYVSFI